MIRRPRRIPRANVAIRRALPGSAFMERAIQLSIEAVQSGQGGPFGAVIVKNGAIIAEGINRVTSTNDPTAHAEILAIRLACEKLGKFELKGCEIYTSCEPCPMCLGAIYWARLARIYFGNSASDAAKAGFDDSFIYAELKNPTGRRHIPSSQIMREEAAAGFAMWAQKPDKIPY
ncbi:MAG TPA: nucleoside deaminase [Candidatus Acidoferrum sp.]|nr:nucleoside deaminase [Candidatus Acidoferrum sp.]